MESLLCIGPRGLQWLLEFYLSSDLMQIRVIVTKLGRMAGGLIRCLMFVKHQEPRKGSAGTWH